MYQIGQPVQQSWHVFELADDTDAMVTARALYLRHSMRHAVEAWDVSGELPRLVVAWSSFDEAAAYRHLETAPGRNLNRGFRAAVPDPATVPSFDPTDAGSVAGLARTIHRLKRSGREGPYAREVQRRIDELASLLLFERASAPPIPAMN